MKSLHTVSFILVVVGAINWGLTAFGWNVVHMLLGSWPTIETIVYVLVGLSGVYLLVSHKRDCRMCDSGMAM